MLRKSLASFVPAAVLMLGPGDLAMTAAAQTMARGPVANASVTATLGAGLRSPILRASSYVPMLVSGVPAAPSLLLAAPAIVAAAPVAASQPQTIAAAPVLSAAAKALSVMAESPALPVIRSQAPSADVAAKAAALNTMYENSGMAGPENSAVSGRFAAAPKAGRLSPSPYTRFKDPKLVGPAVAKIRELFSQVGMWGSGQFEAKKGPSERLTSVHVSPTGKPQADRVTIAVGYRWGMSDSWTSIYLTLIAGDRPVLLIQSEIDEVPFERGAKIPKEGRIKNARLSVGKDSVVLRVEEKDGGAKSYEIRRQGDGSLQYKEIYDEGTVRITLPKKRI